MLQLNKHMRLITLFLVSFCISLQSCNHKEAYLVSNPLEEIFTRSDGPNILETKYDVTQRMAELFLSSNKENPPIVSVEPYGIGDVICFFIFNFEQGFKVVSADTRIQPVLAESEKDNLDSEKTDNPGIRFWLEDTATRIRMIKETNLNTGEDYSMLWSTYRSAAVKESVNTRRYDVDSVWVLVYNTSSEVVNNNADVGPLLSTEWGQNSPWNNKMPKINGTACLTGCVAVAVAQVLYNFHSHNNTPKDFWETISIQSSSICPEHGGLLVTLNKSNYNSNSDKWNAMTSNTSTSHDNVSFLMLDLGERLQMHYGTDFSEVYHSSNLSIPQLSNCGLSYSFSSYSFSAVENDILNSKPVIISGWSLGGGHTWVIDGCKDFSIKYTTTGTYYRVHPDLVTNYPDRVGVLTYDEMMTLYPDATGSYYRLPDSISYVNTLSLHMNWGLGGNGDGWFDLLNNEWQSFPSYRVIHYNLSSSQLN